jgi:hypothetical protein
MGHSLPHTENGLAQIAAEQHAQRQLADDATDDPTTLKFEGRIAVTEEDSGSDPYNRTGRFRRLVR